MKWEFVGEMQQAGGDICRYVSKINSKSIALFLLCVPFINGEQTAWPVVIELGMKERG
jgi:hypothetical protein